MAVISFSIFIASITQTTAPASTSWPFSTFTRSTVPCSGDVERAVAAAGRRPAALAPRRRRALPVEFVPAVTPPPTGGGPMTFTLNRRLSTSTV